MGTDLASIPGYDTFLADLKMRIGNAQTRAALAVNRELVLLYWQIGRDILTRQQKQGWGARVIDRLGRDLRAAFPEMKGFSPRNLKYMRAFADAYPNEAFVQETLAQITWYHNITLLEKVADPTQRDKSKNRTMVEYALRDMNKPLGIAEFRTQDMLPDALQTTLPTIASLESELAAIHAEEAG